MISNKKILDTISICVRNATTKKDFIIKYNRALEMVERDIGHDLSDDEQDALWDGLEIDAILASLPGTIDEVMDEDYYVDIPKDLTTDLNISNK